MVGYSTIRDALRGVAPAMFQMPGYAELFTDAIDELNSAPSFWIPILHQQESRGEEIDVAAHALLRIRQWLNSGELRAICLPVSRWAAPDKDVATNQSTFDEIPGKSVVCGGDHGTDGVWEMNGFIAPIEIGYQPIAKTYIQLETCRILARLPYDPGTGQRPHIAILKRF